MRGDLQMSPATEADANPVRIALMNFLKADPILKGLTEGVFYRKAPQPKEVPYVIVSSGTDVPEWTFAGPPLEDQVWLVKGVGSANAAEAINRRVKKLLNRDCELEIEGMIFHSIFWIAGVDYEDSTDGERYQHVGAEYRIKTEEVEK